MAAPVLPLAVSRPKITPADKVLDRFRWDQSLGPNSDYTVGYEDRFLGTVECPVSSFDVSEIPCHRIRFFKRNSAVVWDRAAHFDILTHPDFPYPEVPQRDARPAPPPKMILPADASKRERRLAELAQAPDDPSINVPAPVFSRVAVAPVATCIPEAILARRGVHPPPTPDDDGSGDG